MTQGHSTQFAATRKKKSAKPDKPYPEFPLYPHATKRWAKRIRGVIHYFGPWNDPDGSLAKYLDQKDDLHAGRTPRAKSDGLTMRDLANRFLTHKQQLLNSGEIKQRTWNELDATCSRLIDTFGRDRFVDDLACEDFEKLRAQIAEVWGAVRLGNEVQRVRSVFKYAYDAGMIEAPMRFGPGFKRPSKKVLRKLRAEQGPRLFAREDLLSLIEKASTQMKAMILLGVNVGFGNEDCGRLPLAAVDLVGGWVSFPRPKTGADRRAKLWPETVKALRKVLADRRDPIDPADAGLVFITMHGHSWTNANKGATAATFEMRKLLVNLKIKKPGLNFYALRHTFRTIADESRDQPAVDFIMGHTREDMASLYRERIGDDRLEAVANQVRKWLFNKTR